MSSRLVFQRVRPAGPAIRSAHLGHDLPEAWLIAEWPPGEPEPVKIKTGLGLDHYEGRTWQGWHHHTTLVSAAPLFSC